MVDVEYIKKRHDEGWGIRKIARRFEVSRQTVRKVLGAPAEPPRYRRQVPRCDWRTAKKYLSAETALPPGVRREPAPRLIDAFAAHIDAMLTREPRLHATVIHERLVAEHGFPGSYQRVKLCRPGSPGTDRSPAPDLTRRFEVLPGAQAQVDWGARMRSRPPWVTSTSSAST